MFSGKWNSSPFIFSLALVLLCPFVGGGGTVSTNQTTPTTAWEPPPYRYHVTDAISLVECIIGILANGFLLLVMFMDPLNNLKKFSFLTIGNLAFADFMTSVCTIPFCVNEANIPDKTSAFIANAFQFVGYFASFFLLLLFAVERFIAVAYPFQSRHLLTRKKTIAACVVCWALSITLSFLTMLGMNMSLKDGAKLYIGIYAVLEAVAVFLVVFKILILYKVLKYSKDTAQVTDPGREKQTREIAITLVLLIIILLVTAFPYFVGKQVEYVGRLTLTDVTFPYYYLPVSCLNFIVNPFIYSWRLQDYRNAFFALFRSRREAVSQYAETERMTKI